MTPRGLFVGAALFLAVAIATLAVGAGAAARNPAMGLEGLYYVVLALTACALSIAFFVAALFAVARKRGGPVATWPYAIAGGWLAAGAFEASGSWWSPTRALLALVLWPVSLLVSGQRNAFVLFVFALGAGVTFLLVRRAR